MTYQFFSKDELACKCCGVEKMNPQFMKKLIDIRQELDFPLFVTSAYRCPLHNASVSKTGLKGPHTTGRAIDIRATSPQRYLIIRSAMKHGIARFGIAPWGIHLDDLSEADGFASGVIWTY